MELLSDNLWVQRTLDGGPHYYCFPFMLLWLCQWVNLGQALPGVQSRFRRQQYPHAEDLLSVAKSYVFELQFGRFLVGISEGIIHCKPSDSQLGAPQTDNHMRTHRRYKKECSLLLTCKLEQSNIGFSSMCWSSLPGVQIIIFIWSIRFLSNFKSFPPVQLRRNYMSAHGLPKSIKNLRTYDQSGWKFMLGSNLFQGFKYLISQLSCWCNN